MSARFDKAVDQVRRRPWLLLIPPATGLVVLLVAVGRWLLFWLDEWDYLLARADPSPWSWFVPHVDTLNAVPVVVYQVLMHAFGIASYWPWLIVAWAAHLVIVALVYRISRRRAGPGFGLIAATSVLLLGSGWEVLLQPFQMQYLFGAIGGLVAIDQLERRDEAARRVAVAAVALVVALGSSSVGVLYGGLVLAWGLLGRDRRILAAPVPAIALYATWYLAWRPGRDAPFGALGPVDSAVAVIRGLGAAVAGIVGLEPAQFAEVGAGLAAIIAAGLGVAMARGYRPPALAIAAVAALLAQNVLQTLLRGDIGIHHASRSGYVYVGVLFAWIAAAALVGDRFGRLATRVRPGWQVPAIALVLVGVAVVGNLRQLVDAAQAARGNRATELAELRVLEELRGDTALRLDTVVDPELLPNVFGGRYFPAIDRFGRPDLAYDWQPHVDRARVEAARERLLGR